MDTAALKRQLARVLSALAIAVGVAVLLLLERSVENSADFDRWQPWTLAASVLGVLALGALLGRKLWQLVRDFRDHVPGSRLTLRTVGLFGSLVILPLLVVYLFSLDFLDRGIDSWFRIEIKQGLNDALVLSRSALDLRLREQARRTEDFARSLRGVGAAELPGRLEAERRAAGAVAIVVYGPSGRPLALSTGGVETELPRVAATEVLVQIGAGHSYYSLVPLADGRYSITTAAPLDDAHAAGERRFVIMSFGVPEELSGLAEAVQRAYQRYGDLSAQRQPLKYNFRFALTLVLLLTLLAAIYGAIASAQRLTRPVQALIAGTRAVGKGDFATRLPLPSRDEMGFLVASFNDMTKRLKRASEEAVRSREAVEHERERLAVILSRLASGVVVIDHARQVRSANPAATEILGVGAEQVTGQGLAGLAGPDGTQPRLARFASELAQRLDAGRREWREQLTLPGESGDSVLLWTATPLRDASADDALVVVFEDITALLTAQRSAAWGEVARRLAHEIKNPLTPIQLSAERLRRRLLPGLAAEDAELLERATHTIAQQVAAMKQMVNAFSEYARAPDMQLAHFSLNQLVQEVAELYRLQDPACSIELDLGADLPEIEADRGRVRQVLANLITNGIEALAGVSGGKVTIATRLHAATGSPQAAVIVTDNGPGFRRDLLAKAFEPYVTTKARGTGLGLAIVKRIIDEHGGRIEAENGPEGGARVLVLLPVGPGGARVELRKERA
ncbi:MAG: HAMP domain-containing protein [Gammaproteobacteria bacterium]|nr:HAMP domain-containing protein [Gammaproteobacteria bacterium]